MRQVVVDFAPKFERGTGHRLLITFDSGAMIVRRLAHRRGRGGAVAQDPFRSSAARRRVRLVPRDDARGCRLLDSSRVDFKLGARRLAKYPALSLIGGAGLAVGVAIGAGCTIFHSATTRLRTNVRR
jgi:hypothetical protein